MSILSVFRHYKQKNSPIPLFGSICSGSELNRFGPPALLTDETLEFEFVITEDAIEVFPLAPDPYKEKNAGSLLPPPGRKWSTPKSSSSGLSNPVSKICSSIRPKSDWFIGRTATGALLDPVLDKAEIIFITEWICVGDMKKEIDWRLASSQSFGELTPSRGWIRIRISWVPMISPIRANGSERDSMGSMIKNGIWWVHSVMKTKGFQPILKYKKMPIFHKKIWFL